MMDSILSDGNRRMRNKGECSFGNDLSLNLFAKDIPDGVIIVTAGGLKGYSGGNFSVPVAFRIVIIMKSTHVLSAYA
jgi:hypothetical protein